MFYFVEIALLIFSYRMKLLLLPDLSLSHTLASKITFSANWKVLKLLVFPTVINVALFVRPASQILSDRGHSSAGFGESSARFGVYMLNCREITHNSNILSAYSQHIRYLFIKVIENFCTH